MEAIFPAGNVSYFYYKAYLSWLKFIYSMAAFATHSSRPIYDST